MNTFLIDSRELYEYARSRGYEPLIQTRFFRLEIGLRKELQRERFGNGHTPEENEKFYRWMWANKPHYCEECMRPLAEYSAVYVSHILTRGANPDMAHDPRNVNILCFRHHSEWENGDRENMRILAKNQLTIEELKKDYGKNITSEI